MEQVRNLFTKNIDIQNLARELITLSFQTDSASQPMTRITFKSTLVNKVIGISVLSANITSSNLTYLQKAPFISFSQSSNIITILNIAGLDPETKYDFLLETVS